MSSRKGGYALKAFQTTTMTKTVVEAFKFQITVRQGVFAKGCFISRRRQVHYRVKTMAIVSHVLYNLCTGTRYVQLTQCEFKISKSNQRFFSLQGVSPRSRVSKGKVSHTLVAS